VESEPLKDTPISGFTLELDGSYEEIGRILGAVYREMSQIQFDNLKREDELNIGRNLKYRPYLLGRLNVHGTLHYRKAI
jgi:hypothetical protein